jgi:hypothetical protein
LEGLIVTKRLVRPAQPKRKLLSFFSKSMRQKLGISIAVIVGIMKEGRLVMERRREELQYEDLVKTYIDYMKSEPLKM